MNNKTHTIAAYYANAVIAGAERLNYDTEALLKSAGLSDIKMDQRVAPQAITQLIQSVWKQLDDEFMGFTQQRCKQGVFAFMARQSIQCRTLREALAQGAQFYHLIRDDVEVSFIDAKSEKENDKEGEAIFSIHLNDESLDPDNLLIEFFLLIWHRFAIWLVGNKVPLKYAEFKYSPPDHVKEYSLFFPCHCRFNQAKNSIVFDPCALSLPIKRSEKELYEFLKKSPEDLLSKPLFSNTFTSQVMTYMGEAINEGSLNAVPLIEDVASYFNMSSRNLRRRLSEENNSYQSIKDTLRKNHAIKLLTDNELAINQISREVGFNEPAAFTRAFKQWTGQTPRNFRQGY